MGRVGGWRCDGLSYETRTCPPTSHTVKLMFLYSTVSTLNPAQRGADTRVDVRRRKNKNTKEEATPHVAARPTGPTEPKRTNGGDGGHHLAELELVQNCGLRGGNAWGREGGWGRKSKTYNGGGERTDEINTSPDGHATIPVATCQHGHTGTSQGEWTRQRKSAQ